MWIREYKPTDCEQMAELFYNTVHSVNSKDYTEEELNAWATGRVDLQEWTQSFLKHKTVVVIENDEIVGFGDIDDSGYLDRLYVHKDYQGVKTFFQHRGYRIVKEQKVIRQGIALINYIMEKRTDSSVS